MEVARHATVIRKPSKQTDRLHYYLRSSVILHQSLYHGEEHLVRLQHVRQDLPRPGQPAGGPQPASENLHLGPDPALLLSVLAPQPNPGEPNLSSQIFREGSLLFI